MAPVIFLNRTQIYSSLLSRHDDYVESYDESGLPVTDYGYQAGIYVGPQTTQDKLQMKQRITMMIC